MSTVARRASFEVAHSSRCGAKRLNFGRLILTQRVSEGLFLAGCVGPLLSLWAVILEKAQLQNASTSWPPACELCVGASAYRGR